MNQPPVGPDPARALCPICLDYFPWREDPLYERVVEASGARWEPVNLSGINNAVKRADRRARCYVKCTNPSRDGTPEHYLPVSHRGHGEPVVIGLVGRGKSGKTHLLVAMLLEALRGDLSAHGLSFEPADEFRHLLFKQSIDQFLRGKKLDSTKDRVHDFAAYFLVRTPDGRARPLIFFDVAGEDFMTPGLGGRNARFLLGATALMFVDDPEHTVPARRPDAIDGPAAQNDAFNTAVARLRSRGDIRKVPVAVVITKADELRYEHPVDRWFRRDDASEPLSAAGFRAESRDVFALLHHHGAQPVLEVFEQFDRGTLHVVSATGTPVDQGVYPRGVRPVRVLRPLLALLAMTGVVEGPEASEVGR
ncbi:hypothetical protein AB0I60_20505 [Actinosynnema sp. NPDC050436]|uniref:TRAFAC clade GTPase domain-containing protein n=1 Tax=Actinosynnema sp. NPDC050436 TaxID=3155659 RepID=UPI0033D080EA